MRMMEKIKRITWLSIAILTFSGIVWSQSAGQAELQIARTNEMLERISSQIPDENDALWELYMQAVQLQDNARELYSGGQWSAAESMSRQAYNICIKIKKQLSQKQVSADAQTVERIIEKFDQIVKRIDPADLSSSDKQLYEQAIELARLSREKLEDGNIPVARGLAMASWKAIGKIDKSVRQAQKAAKVIQAVERTDRILESIGKMPLEHLAGAAQNLMEALEMQIAAHKALDEGNIEVATKITFQAREKVQNIWKNVVSGSAEAFARTKIERTESALIAISPTDAHQQSEYKRARGFIDKARNFIAEGKFDEAMKSIQEAEIIIAEIISAGESLDKDKVHQAIKMTDDFIAGVDISNADGVVIGLLTQAKALQSEAKRDLEKGNIRRSLDKTRMARTIAGQAKSLSR